MTPLEKKQIIMSCWANYQRWLSEGMPTYKEDQYYYDPYHAGIYSVKDREGIYCCSYQYYDSPDGDYWVYYTFKPINGGIDVEILEENYRAR